MFYFAQVLVDCLVCPPLHRCTQAHADTLTQPTGIYPLAVVTGKG
jgi:hypothetical protein